MKQFELSEGLALAIIGTAGRDKTKPFTRRLWEAMCEDARDRVRTHGFQTVVSGGAAWADHLATHLFLTGLVARMTLHLPAPLQSGHFAGPFRSSGSAATYYHHRFSEVIGTRSIEELERCVARRECQLTQQPVAVGYRGMFERNKLVARDAGAILAYTWGDGDVPADGGTRHTWDQCDAQARWHIRLNDLAL